MFSPASNLSLISRLRNISLNNGESDNNATAAAVENETSSPLDDDHNDLDEILRRNLTDMCDDEDTEGNSLSDESAGAYAMCQTIDECMHGLHALPNEKSAPSALSARHPALGIDFEYDWILDGEDPRDLRDGILTPRTRRRKLLGEPALDRPLDMMELEDPSLVTASCSPDSVLEEDEGIVEFANFDGVDFGESKIQLSVDNGEDGAAGDEGTGDFKRDDWGGFASVEILVPEEAAVKFDEEVGDVQIEEESPEADEQNDFIGCVVATTEQECQTQSNDTPEYYPPSEILQIVADIDAELDVTIDECLSTSTDEPVAEESDYFDATFDSLGGALQSAEDNFDNSNNAEEVQTKQFPPGYRQPLLMSSMLMESLPMPIPDMDSEPVSSFTYRVQKSHRDAIGLETTELLDDEILERKLIDSIHSGYFDGAGGDDGLFDSIVLDEVLNVPWPFHQIDLNEPIIEDEHSDLNPEEIDSSDALNFDSYIFNRLSQLDLAKGEVMNSIISRVSLKKNDIDAENQQILAAELDVATALMYANSSREFLHRMLNGYPITDGPHSNKSDHYNAILGSVNVLEIADTKDRLHYLAETIEQISDIHNQEALFWKEIPDRRSHGSTAIPTEKYQILVERARKLKGLTLEEEVLNHVVSLHSLRNRIGGLSIVLLDCMEDSLADLVRRMLNAGNACSGDFSMEYETLLHAWIACCQLRAEGEKITTSQMKAIAEEWSGCLLKVLCFEISKAYVYSMIDMFDEGKASEESTFEIEDELCRLKCSLSKDSDTERLSNKLLADQHLASSAFSFLASRSTELLCLYYLLVEWHSNVLVRLREANDSESPDDESDAQNENDDNLSLHSRMSSMSADDLTGSVSFKPDDAVDDDTSDEESKGCPPQTFEFQGKLSKPAYTLHEYMFRSMNQSIRHPLFTYCESKLTQMIEAYISRPFIKLVLDDLRMMADVLEQFTRFSAYFLEEDADDESQVCKTIRNELTELYLSHLRSVHIEAMKTTGTQLRHESWQLSPINLSLTSVEEDEKKSDGSGGMGDEHSAVMASLYHSIEELLLGFLNNNSTSGNRIIITERAILHGYGQCRRLMPHLKEQSSFICDNNTGVKGLHLRESEKLKEFASFIMQFVERQPRGDFSASIMTQSAVNGLLKWTARLLSIGMALPSVASEAAAAMMTLFDLYILTVFRFCARSGMNEDALQGFKSENTAKVNPSMLSLTIEADICSPLPQEDLSSLQKWVAHARKRLEGIVNLDKFQSSDASVSCPGSKNDLGQVAVSLEKEVAGVVSSMFASILADIASQLLSDSQARDKSFEAYANDVISMTPQLIKQSCRLSCVHSLAGKDILFKILCVGKAWEDNEIKEHSNAYADDLHERCGELWAIMSTSSSGLPYPILKYTWDQIVRASFHTLLEGFSKVPNCSTEGRSLMSMDLATLSDGLNPDTVKKNMIEEYPSITAPPASCRGEVKHYVDAYIKVFFYPDEVLYQWIQENSKEYRMDHVMSLIAAKSASDKSSVRFWDLLDDTVRELYKN